MANAKGWSYRTGEKGTNRVRAYEKDARIFLEFYERTSPGAEPVRKRVSLPTTDREIAKLKADELAAALRRLEIPQASTLTLQQLFDNWYLREVTPGKSPGKQRHDKTCAEMFCRCFGGKRHPRTLNVRDWQKFIRERRAGTLRPLSIDAHEGEKKPLRAISDFQIRYDLKFLMAVLNFATMARDDSDVPLLAHNPLKGLPYPSEDNPRRPMLLEDRYEKMRAVAPQVHRLCETFFVLVNETGHRGASVRQLRWSDVDLDAGTARWRAEGDKIGFLHTTPLTAAAIDVLARLQKAEGAIGEQWVFPSDSDPSRPLPRHTAAKWWRRADEKAGLVHVLGMGFHSARRKFASELKGTNLRDLAYMGGWKNPQTVLTIYQQPEMEVQREALATRKKLRVAGSP
jgi:integrase